MTDTTLLLPAVKVRRAWIVADAIAHAQAPHLACAAGSAASIAPAFLHAAIGHTQLTHIQPGITVIGVFIALPPGRARAATAAAAIVAADLEFSLVIEAGEHARFAYPLSGAGETVRTIST